MGIMRAWNISLEKGMVVKMNKVIKKLEEILEFGGMKRDILFLILSASALLMSIFKVDILPFDMAWFAIVLCGFRLYWKL